MSALTRQAEPAPTCCRNGRISDIDFLADYSYRLPDGSRRFGLGTRAYGSAECGVGDINLKAKEGGWFGQSSYACEFERYPFEAFLPALEDPSLPFVTEEPLPEGYRPGDIVL